MAKRLDVEKVRSALKSAAKNAVSGPRELRSGRIVVARDSRTGQFLAQEKARSSDTGDAAADKGSGK
jgi:hypothetical protein